MDIETQAVIRAQAGDAEAFRAIVELHGPLLYRSAYLMTGSRQNAEDAVQEAFLKAWRGIRSFDAGTNLRGWLIKVLANHVIGSKRKRLLPAVRFNLDMPEQASPHTPERAVEMAETAEETLLLLDYLRPDERTVVVMHYYMEMTLAEIAAATGWRDGTVRSRLSRALGRLRERLSEQGAVSEVGMWPASRSVSHDEA